MRTGPAWKISRTDATTPLKQQIRAEAARIGMTQRDLAKKSGMSEKHVSRVLTGQERGTFNILCRLADAAGLAIVAVRKRRGG